MCTVEPRYNEVLGITNEFLSPSNSKIYEKVPRKNETLVVGIANTFRQSLNSSLTRGCAKEHKFCLRL